MRERELRGRGGSVREREERACIREKKKKRERERVNGNGAFPPAVRIACAHASYTLPAPPPSHLDNKFGLELSSRRDVEDQSDEAEHGKGVVVDGH